MNEGLPTTKNAGPRVPEVPEKDYLDQPFAWKGKRGWSYLVVLLILSLCVWGITAQWASFFSPSSTPVPMATSVSTPGQIPGFQLDCPNPPPVQSGGPPALSFCSPLYHGDIAGSFGARIVLIVNNFSTFPDEWLIPKKPVQQNDTLKACSDAQANKCMVLPAPSLKKEVRSGVFLVSWLWQAPFPANPGDYFMTAWSGNQFATTSINFTLKSTQPPCITLMPVPAGPVGSTNSVGLSVRAPVPIRSVQKPVCSAQTVTLQRGATIRIDGENWLLGWSPTGTAPLDMQIRIIATCISTSCGEVPLFDETVSSEELDRNGTFSHVLTLSPSLVGMYTVSAWNETPVIGSLGGKVNTAANQALFFGQRESDLLLDVS